MDKPVKAFLGVVLILGFLSTAFAQDTWYYHLRNQNWLSRIRRIDVLSSSVTDVERILGKPERFEFSMAEFVKYYPTNAGRISITYTTVGCLVNNGKDVPKNLVEEVTLAPVDKITLLNLKLPLSDFNETHEEDAPSIGIYKNERNGVTIVVQNEYVSSISFSPPSNLHYVCSDR
jgi:hypothetical protein